jgi:hypothetical protein
MRLLVAAILAALCAAAPARAAMLCGDAESLEKHLAEHTGQRPFAEAKMQDWRLVLYLNAETRDVTILVLKDGTACVLATGTEFSPAAAAPAPKGDGS